MKYYCIGIKGAGMSTLACILNDLGNKVTGYDDVKEYKFTCDGLIDRGIEIFYDNDHEIDSDTLVTYSVAVPQDHKELKRCRDLGLKIVKYNEILGEITGMFESICVSGSHGKTTTSSIIKHILDDKYTVNYFIGDGSGHAIRDNKLFVIESDEFNRHFLTYHPSYTIITNIEKEHMEIYKDLEDIISTYETFASKTKNKIIACGDNENIRKIKYNKPVIYYGFNKDNEYCVDNVKVDENYTSFDLYHEGTLLDSFKVPIFGEHMALNTAAAIIMCMEENVELSEIKRLLLTFKNAKRRFETTIVNGTTIVDDYAHHPTEIGVTLKAAKERYKDKEVVAVFKSNTYSRIQDFCKEFHEALNIADKVYLTEVDSNRERAEDYPGISAKLILDGLNNGEMIDEDSVDKLLKHKGQVIVFMSCASIAHLKQKLIELLDVN